MFNDDDIDPKNKRIKPRNLDNMSIAELEQYIADMKAEIVRVEENITKKRAHKDAVSSLFKS